MKQSLLLLLSATRLHAQLMAGGKILLQREFNDSQDGWNQFSDFIKANKHTTYLLTDLIEEDFRHEIVPHLRGRRHAALLKRKFDQFYRDTPFHQATLLRRQKTGRRDDDMIFSALTNPALIKPWLDILLVHEVPLAGIYSIPQISAALITNHSSNHLLLISWGKSSGLRQTYFSQNRLQISRLTAIRENKTFNDALLKELDRTFQYLKSLSLLPANQTLDVRILCHAKDREELKNKLVGNEDMRYDFADLGEIGRQLKINYRFTDSDASQIFLHQLALSQPKTHYGNEEHTHFHSILKLNVALKWTAIPIFVASLALTFPTVLESDGSQAENKAQQQQTQLTLIEADAIILALPASDVAPIDMKSGVNVMNKLEQYQLQTQDILLTVSDALDQFPQIQIDDLKLLTSATEPVAVNTRADIPAHVITIKGNLHGFDNNYRSILKYLDRFQLELRKKNFQVEALSKPLDVSPGGSLDSSLGTQEDALKFSLKVVWRPLL
jgi:hypothetical protein